MRLEEAIKHAKEQYEENKKKDFDRAYEHHKLAEWLEELLDYRTKNGIKPQIPPSNCGWILREYDSFDHNWIDIKTSDNAEEIKDYWNEYTSHGTKNTQYRDGTYYAIFPANTKMIFSGH